MAEGDVKDDGNLAEDMMNVEALLGHNVVQMVTDNLILDLLRTHSSDKNRVQKVVCELQRTYLKDDLALYMDEDDVLLALDSPYLSSSGSSKTSNDRIGSTPSSKTSLATTSRRGVVSSSSRGLCDYDPQNIREKVVLQPAKLKISGAQRTNHHLEGRPESTFLSTSNISPAVLNERINDPFSNHRKGNHDKVSEDSFSSNSEEDEPEVVSIREEDRKRKKICGNKSPGKKTRVEIVDLVDSSPRSSLNYEDYLGILEAMFPDADPIFLMQKFQHIENEQELNVKAAALLESNNYPRIGAGAVNFIEGERQSSMKTNNPSVIIKPSAFGVPRTSEHQPSSSSNVCTNNENIVRSEHAGSQSSSTLDDTFSCTESLEVVNKGPQPNGAASEIPSSSGIPKQGIHDRVPLCAQNVPNPKTMQPNAGDVSTSSALPLKTSKLPPTSETLTFPSSHVKDTRLPQFSTVQKNGIVCSVDEPGPSHRKEDSWAEKYSILLSLFPQYDLKFLEDKAKLLSDKDVEFNLFVETTLEHVQNPPEGNNQGNEFQELPVNPSKAVNGNLRGTGVANVLESSDVNRPEARNAAVLAPEAANVLQTGSTNSKGSTQTDVPQKSSAIVPRPSSSPPRPDTANSSGTSSVNVPVPSTTSIHQPSGFKAPELSTSKVASPSVPGPSNVNVAKPSATSVPGPSNADVPGPSGINVAGPSGINSGVTDVCPWADKHCFLQSILPDADPSYLEEKAKSLYDKDEDFKNFVANALENKDYPTLKDYQRRQEIIALQNKYLNNFNIENFLDIVPEPFKYFSQTKRKPSPDSQERGLLYLKRKYRVIRSNDITSVYRKQQYNLTNTCHELNRFKGVPLKSRRPDFDIADKLPDNNISLQFLQEVAFIENEDKIKKYLKDKVKDEERALKEAREKGELLECNCCFDDEVIARNIVTCPEGHVFCKDCVRKGVETKIGDGETKLSCLTECQAEFTLQSLQGVLKPTVFSKLAQRKQLEEIKAAGIEDLVQCPFCDFCNIPGAGDKLFRCLNPDCMKDSCIMCKEVSHIPLRCDEVEKASEVKMRTYIEDKMTEALVRTCWKCQRKFVKIDGCNKMTCQCGALMCYICRQPVKDYSHFNGQGGDAYHKCPLFSDNNSLHVDAVEKVAAEAKAELAQKHPGVALKHDPTSVPIPREAGGRRPGQPLPIAQIPIGELPYEQRGFLPNFLGDNVRVMPPVFLPPVAHPAALAGAANEMYRRLHQYPFPPPRHLPPRHDPIPAYRHEAIPAHRHEPIPLNRPEPIPHHRHHARNYDQPHRNQRAALRRMEVRIQDIQRLAADLRREGEQFEAANRNQGQPLRRADAGLAYQAELARPVFPVLPPPVDVAAPNANAYYAQNMLYNRQPYHQNQN